MDNEQGYIQELIVKYLQSTLTANEQKWLEKWKNERIENSLFFDEVTDSNTLSDKLRLYAAHDQEIALKEALRVINAAGQQPVHARPARLFRIFPNRKWAAASILLLLAIGSYCWFQFTRPQTVPSGPQQVATNILPGKEGAVLTLADGSQLVLDSLHDGLIATQNGSQIVLKNNKVAYAPVSEGNNTIVYNTMRTTKGRQYQFTLPDGTQVWLNAGSSIRYPTAFTGKERRVEMTGEAYFEVAKNKQMPFTINANNKATIEVLGTHFNVNAYENEESLYTTLLEGSVQVHAAKNTSILKPGQQAQVAGGIRIVDDADLNKVMAWKNGLFDFDNVSLKQAMREIERWYNIEVVYENEVPEITFGGKLPKSISLNDLLSVLEESNVHFRLDGTKLIVSK